MRSFASKQFVGALALLFSSASMAATVTVTSLSGPTVNVGDTFILRVSGADFPSTAGATLGLSFDSSVVNILDNPVGTGIALSPGSPFTGGVVAFAPWNLVSVLGPLVGTLPSGSFDAFDMKFTALAPGAANIQLIDDGADLCWTDAVTFGCVTPMSYTQANVTVVAPVVPVPAAVWLLVSGLGALVGMKRFRRS